MAEQKRALRLDGGQFTRLIKITRATSRYADRDVLVLMLGHHTGMRVTEISRITVADVLHPSGKLRQKLVCEKPSQRAVASAAHISPVED